MTPGKLRWFDPDLVAKKYSPEKFAARSIFLARTFRWTLVELSLTKRISG